MTNTAKKAKNVSPLATREKLLLIAEDLFTEHGLEAVTLRAVATKAGLTPMAIYRHFDDKESLIRELIQRGFDHYAQYLDIVPKPNPVKHLEALAGRVFDFALEKSAYFELMFLTSKKQTGFTQQEVLHEVQKPTYAIAAKAIRACNDQNAMRVENVKDMTNDVLAWCIGFSASYLSGAMAADVNRARSQFRNGFKRILKPHIA